MYTEEEAKTKWCPFVRYSVENASKWKRAINRWVSVNDMQLNPEPCHCIASECMVWRWDTDDGYPAKEGYCGLAGKP